MLLMVPAVIFDIDGGDVGDDDEGGHDDGDDEDAANGQRHSVGRGCQRVDVDALLGEGSGHHHGNGGVGAAVDVVREGLVLAFIAAHNGLKVGEMDPMDKNLSSYEFGSE